MAEGDTQVLLPLCEELVWLWTGQCSENCELSLARDAAGCGLDELHIYRLSNLCLKLKLWLECLGTVCSGDSAPPPPVSETLLPKSMPWVFTGCETPLLAAALFPSPGLLQWPALHLLICQLSMI